MKKLTVDEMKEVARDAPSPSRAKKKSSALEARVRAAWDPAAPSRHSHFDNLIPTWQRALLRFAENLEGSLTER